MPATYTLIASNTLTSTSASVTFSSIPGTYTDLVLKISARSIRAVTANTMQLKFNSNSSSYSLTSVETLDGTSATSSRVSNGTIMSITATPGANSTSNTFSNNELYIPNYAGNVNKPFSSFGVSEDNATAGVIQSYANLWSNTSAITSIDLTSITSSFASGSSFFLYGIKSS